MQQNYNQMFGGEPGEFFHLPEHPRDFQDKPSSFQSEIGSMSPLKVSHSKKQQTGKKKGNRQVSKDLIQLPESIPESVLGQSNRNLYLQQFLQDQLQKKSQDYVAQNI